MSEITITEMAIMLKEPYPKSHRRVLLGEVRSRRTATGRFLVDRLDVERLALRMDVSMPAAA